MRVRQPAVTALIPVRLGRWDADAQLAGWRTAIDRWGGRLRPVGLIPAVALLGWWALTGGPRPGWDATALAVGLQLALGTAAAPILGSAARGRAAAATAVAGAVLFLSATGLLLVRWGVHWALAMVAAQAAVQLVPQLLVGRLWASRFVELPPAGTVAAALHRDLTVLTTSLRTAQGRWLCPTRDGAVVAAVLEQRWDARGPHPELVVHPSRPLSDAVRAGRALHRHLLLIFPDGSRLGLRVRTPRGAFPRERGGVGRSGR